MAVIPPRFPDYFEPLVAWRGWTVDASGGLHGAAHRELWIPGMPYRAICKVQENEYNRDHSHAAWEAPQWRCSCGIYAYKTLEAELTNMLGQEYDPRPTLSYANHVLGQVSLWGRIIAHEVGYRAQWGYPKALIVSEEIGEHRIKVIRKEYKVETQTVPHIGSYLMQLVRDFAKGNG